MALNVFLLLLGNKLIISFSINITGIWGSLGVILLFISAIGKVMGGLFDVKHKYHELAALLGAHCCFIDWLQSDSNSVIATTGLRHPDFLTCHMVKLCTDGTDNGDLIAGFKKSGIPMGPNAEIPTSVPPGVIAWAGDANRLIVICYVGWLLGHSRELGGVRKSTALPTI